MTGPRFKSLPLIALLALAACSTPDAGEYPSLAIREGERVSGTLAPPEPPAFVPDPVAPATLAELDSLVESARAAHGRFLAAEPEVRRPVAAARGASLGSENYAVASVAIARLETLRSEAMIALADIDRLYVVAATQEGAIERIGAARDEVEGLVQQETATIEGMLATIGS